MKRTKELKYFQNSFYLTRIALKKPLYQINHNGLKVHSLVFGLKVLF